jgi:cytochrome c556
MRLVSALALAVSVGAFGAGIASAQQKSPIEEREALMKSFGRAATLTSKMVKGELPYEAGKVGDAFETWGNGIKKFGSLFPEDSKTGGDTRALPKIWSDRAEFEKHIADFEKDVAAQKANAISGLDGLKQAMAVVGKDCGGCHKEFRAEKK